jgi:hypothetical protein
MENDRYWQKNNFLLFAKCLKMYRFFRICILRLLLLLLYDPKNFYLEKYQYGYQINAEFYADFKFVNPGFQKCSYQKLNAKNHEKMQKTKILKIRIVFWL